MKLRPPVKVVAALALSVVAVAGFGPSSSAAPNPYGRSSAAVEITLDAKGGYRAIETVTQEVVGAGYNANLDGRIPDSFRLIAGREDRLPPLLTPTVTLETATLNGESRPARLDRIGRALTARVGETGKRIGKFTAVFTSSVSGATVREPDGSGPRILAVHARPFLIDRNPEVTIKSGGQQIVDVRCITAAPTTVPCGSRTPNGWRITREQLTTVKAEMSFPGIEHQASLGFVVRIADTGQKLVEPVLDLD